MPTLIVYPHPIRKDIRQVHGVDHGTCVADWLAEHQPQMSERFTVYANSFEVTKDYVIVNTDTVVVNVTPADPITAAIAAISWKVVIAQVVVSMAVSAVIGALFRPKKPSSNTPEPSPTYGISAQGNTYRLGDVIPVIYGKVLVTPAYAAQPVIEFVDNQQIFKGLYCITQGSANVSSMMIGESDVVGLSAGVVDWRVFKPRDHKETFGIIEATTGVPENVYTCDEVGDQELLAPGQAIGSSAPTWMWRFVSVSEDPASVAGLTQMTVEQLKQAPTFVVNTRHYYTEEQHHTSEAGTTVYLWFYIVEAQPLIYPIPPGSVLPNVTSTSTNVDVGAFSMCRPDQTGDEAALDFVFPGGLYKGDLQGTNVQIKVTFQPVDANGAATGAALVYNHTFSASSNTPQRYTVKWPLPPARYTAKCERVTPSDGKGSTVDRVTWTGLKLRLTKPPKTVRVYGDVTLVAVTIKATNEVNGSSLSKVRFNVDRNLGGPVESMVDILTANYGGRRPVNDAELDQAEINAMKAKLAGTEFNAVFDTRGTVWEAMVLSLQTAACAPLSIGSKITIVRDSVKTRTAVFSDMNIVAGTMSVGYVFDKVGDPTGVKVEYRDPLSWTPAYVHLPDHDDNAQSINLFGCSSRDVALQHANLIQNRRKGQRKSISFETEMEGLLVRHGDRIAVSHSMPRWGQAAAIQAVGASPQEFVLDRYLDWTGATSTSEVLLRGPEGQVFQTTGTKGASEDRLTLAALPPWAITVAGGTQEPTHVIFAYSAAIVEDWIVTEMEPTGDTRIKISAVVYDPAVYDNALPHQKVL
jgi:hypothetical protein